MAGIFEIPALHSALHYYNAGYRTIRHYTPQEELKKNDCVASQNFEMPWTELRVTRLYGSSRNSTERYYTLADKIGKIRKWRSIWIKRPALYATVKDWTLRNNT